MPPRPSGSGFPLQAFFRLTPSKRLYAAIPHATPKQNHFLLLILRSFNLNQKNQIYSSLTFFLDEKSKQKNQDARRNCGGGRTASKNRPHLGFAETGDPTLFFVRYSAWRQPFANDDISK